jgi:hypothetical protein
MSFLFRLLWFWGGLQPFQKYFLHPQESGGFFQHFSLGFPFRLIVKEKFATLAALKKNPVKFFTGFLLKI